jgi:hypothetical protein
MLCPSNPAHVSRTYAQILGSDGSNFSAASNAAGSPEGQRPDGTPKVNPCRRILGAWSGGGAIPPGAARHEIVEKQIFLPGYNTNYCASWWLVRSGVTLNASGNVFSPGGLTPVSPLERHCTIGPLMRAKLDSSGVSSSIVPLLCDAATSSEFLSQNLGDVQGGQPMAHSMTGGPVQPATMAPPAANSAGTPGPVWWSIWNSTLQDYRQFGVPRKHA